MTNFRYYISTALRNLWESKVTSLFTLVTLSVALGFLGAYLAVFINMQAALSAVSEKFPMSVYLSDGAGPGELADIRERLASEPAVDGFDYTSRDDALKDFRAALGSDAHLIENLGENPLPASFNVRLKTEAEEGSLMKLAARLRAMPGVDEVSYMKDEAGRLHLMMATFRLAGFVLGIGVLLGVVFISYSTLRLAVLSHAREIEAMKLMGATRGFIMGPFLLEGTFQGTLAGALSLGILYGLLRVFSGASSAMLLSTHEFSFLPAWAWAGILAAGGLLGLAGSFFAFSRTLRM